MKLKKYLAIGFVGTCIALSFACSSDDAAAPGASSSGISVSGVLSGLSLYSHDKIKTYAVTDYSVKCVTFATVPVAGSAVLDGSGGFALSMAGAAVTDPYGCFVLKTVASVLTVVATMVFENTASQSMGGGNAEAGSYVGGSASVNLGAIVVNESTGSAKVDVANITGANAAVIDAGTWTNMTGTWTTACVSDPTNGYECDDMPPSLYFHEFSITDDASASHQGFAVWESATNFTGCGSSENLDAVLPSGWAAVDTALNANYSFDTILASNVTVNWVDNGKTACGQTATAGTTTCDAISGNPDSWGNGAGTTYNEADCEAICISNSVHEMSGTCSQSWDVNYSLTNTITSAGDLTCAAGTSCGTGSGANFITGRGTPEKRFLMNELILSGNRGAVHDEETRTESICVGQTNSGCTNHNCTFTRFTNLSIVQTSTTTATIEVSFHGAIDATSNAACFAQDSNNWVLQEIEESKILFTATKN